MSKVWNKYSPNSIGHQSPHNGTIMPEDFTPEALASRTPEDVENDDIALWVVVYLSGANGTPSFAHLEGVGTCEEIEARNDGERFKHCTSKIREIFKESNIPGNWE